MKIKIDQDIHSVELKFKVYKEAFKLPIQYDFRLTVNDAHNIHFNAEFYTHSCSNEYIKNIGYAVATYDSIGRKCLVVRFYNNPPLDAETRKEIKFAVRAGYIKALRALKELSI